MSSSSTRRSPRIANGSLPSWSGHGPARRDRLLRACGLIIADSTLRSGLVADDSDANPHSLALINNLYKYARDTDVQELCEFNAFVNGNRRLEALVGTTLRRPHYGETRRLGRGLE